MNADFVFSGRLMPHLASLGAALLLFYVGVRSFERMVESGSAAAAEGERATEQAGRKGAEARPELSAISGWHLLGEHKKKPAEAGGKPVKVETQAPKTSLKLNLMGVFSPPGTDGTGWAIISEQKGDELTYQVGDELPGDAVLTAVEESQVIITRNGRQESLPLPRLGGDGEESFPVKREVGNRADTPLPRTVPPSLPTKRIP